MKRVFREFLKLSAFLVQKRERRREKREKRKKKKKKYLFRCIIFWGL
ncbi:hypothetical protein ACMBCN_02705 [Candidatus Liberibacter asiaticus]|nr:hypothetical protein [Candidatus Liberibacter asiaticus]